MKVIATQTFSKKTQKGVPALIVYQISTSYLELIMNV